MKNRMKDPMALMPIGMMFLVIGILFPMIVHPASQAGKNWAEGLHGFAFGLSIAFNLMAVVLKRRAANKAEC